MQNGTRKLKPGAATMKTVLNTSRASRPTGPKGPTGPKTARVQNFFENTSTARPTVIVTQGIRPQVIPVANMFPGPKKPSAFNMSPKNLRLHNRQVAAFNASQSGNYVMPMNQSTGGTGGKRTRKHKQKRRKSN